MPIVLLLDEQPIDQLLKRALIVLRILLVVLGADVVQILLQQLHDALEADEVGHDWQVCHVLVLLGLIDALELVIVGLQIDLLLLVRLALLDARQDGQEGPLQVLSQHIRNNRLSRLLLA